ncbi:uncharacterized protein LOC121868002 isoform X2 [Homarus americanus]|uniref:uncharacterized protein LOC121868002 isoform X2 n=1 Tax=Homarus americanus TaxID=6706 RepID=UPI001C464268|nr:uncharacterized protein LOC121868002 isoform X2 [Homarus americanus]
MVKMGLKELDPAEKWTHPPKKKWIFNYLADDDGGDDGAPDETGKREVFRRDNTYSRVPPTTTTPPTTTNNNTHHHHYHHHHHHLNNNHSGGGLATATSPPPPRTAPSSPGHAREELQHHQHQQRRVPALTPPMGSVRGGVVGCGGQQQTSPRTSVSYPGSPASSSPPHLTVTPRGSAASPLGLLSAFRQDSSSPPTTSTASSASSSDPSSITRLPHDAALHLTNGLTRHNGLSKSLAALSPSPHTLTHHGLYSPEDPAFKDDKKRSGSTPSREVHNKLEKNRRAHLKECFETLRRQLPSMDDKKISNQTILKAAHRHIQNLKRKEREYEHEMERLAREKIAHQQKLSVLKKELSARWDHIDFNALLPDMASLEQHRDKETKSTTTASEQPDLEDDTPRDAGTQASSIAAPCTLSPRLHSEPPRGAITFATIGIDGSSNIGSSGLVPRDHFTDPNQPLNLSTSIVDSSRASPRMQQLVSQGRSPHHNGEWGSRQASPHYTSAAYTTSSEEDTWPSPDSTVAPTLTRETVTSVHGEHLPIMGSTGIHLPAQLVAGGMQLNGAPGGLLGQPAIQVITPEGYKLLPADHAPNGAKPLTITLAHPDGLDRGENSDEVKTSAGPMMVALKNGLPALHLTVPTTARSLSHTQGANGAITTVPLNLSVGGGPTVKVTQATTSSILSSYVPITHPNGITQLVSAGLGSSMGTLVSGIGPSIVTPLVVSQQQRGGMPGTVTTVGSKGIKATAMGGTATSMPLVSTQYTTSLASGLGGLVKPVVVVSAPAAVAGLMAGAHTVASGKP